MDELKKNMVIGLEKKTMFSQILGSNEYNDRALTFVDIFRCHRMHKV